MFDKVEVKESLARVKMEDNDYAIEDIWETIAVVTNQPKVRYNTKQIISLARKHVDIENTILMY